MPGWKSTGDWGAGGWRQILPIHVTGEPGGELCCDEYPRDNIVTGA